VRHSGGLAARGGLRRRIKIGRWKAPKPSLDGSLHVLMLPDLQRAERIGEFWSYPHSRTFVSS
jgi:hypothetical protein